MVYSCNILAYRIVMCMLLTSIGACVGVSCTAVPMSPRTSVPPCQINASARTGPKAPSRDSESVQCAPASPEWTLGSAFGGRPPLPVVEIRVCPRLSLRTRSRCSTRRPSCEPTAPSSSRLDALASFLPSATSVLYPLPDRRPSSIFPPA